MKRALQVFHKGTCCRVVALPAEKTAFAPTAFGRNATPMFCSTSLVCWCRQTWASRLAQGDRASRSRPLVDMQTQPSVGGSRLSLPARRHTLWQVPYVSPVIWLRQIQSFSASSCGREIISRQGSRCRKPPTHWRRAHVRCSGVAGACLANRRFATFRTYVS